MPLKEEKENKSPRDYLRIFCFVIAALELVHSLTYAFNAIYELSLHQNTYNIIAYLGAVVYVLTVKALVVGLWKCIPKLLIFWLIFASLATGTSIVLLIWNLINAPFFNTEHFIQWGVVYLLICYQCACIYLVFRYFRKLCPYSLLEGGNFGCREKDIEKTQSESEDEFEYIDEYPEEYKNKYKNEYKNEYKDKDKDKDKDKELKKYEEREKDSIRKSSEGGRKEEKRVRLSVRK